MSATEILQLAATAYASMWGLYLLLLPLMASLGKPKPVKKIADGWPKVAVIVPAANAERVIARCVGSLHECRYPAQRVDIYVVADHCSDETSEHARAVGAKVLARNDGSKGKTYAIAWAIRELTDRGVSPDLYIIVDATAVVQATFLAAIAAKWRQGEEIISGHSVLSDENQTWYARCLGLMLVHRNLQSRSREQLGLSALLEGRGMAYGRKYIQQFGWSLALPRTQGAHPTEDWRHAVKAVEAGYRVAFADDARVATPLRHSLAEATQQGARWERGRLINAGTYAIRLLMQGVWQRNPIKIFAALDAMQLPVAILAALSVTVTGFAYFFAPVSILQRYVMYLPFTLVALYGFSVVMRGRREGIPFMTILWGPVYLLWRCSSFVLAWVFLDRVDLKGWKRKRTEGRVPCEEQSAPSGLSHRSRDADAN